MWVWDMMLWWLWLWWLWELVCVWCGLIVYCWWVVRRNLICLCIVWWLGCLLLIVLVWFCWMLVYRLWWDRMLLWLLWLVVCWWIWCVSFVVLLWLFCVYVDDGCVFWICLFFVVFGEVWKWLGWLCNWWRMGCVSFMYWFFGLLVDDLVDRLRLLWWWLWFVGWLIVSLYRSCGVWVLLFLLDRLICCLVWYWLRSFVVGV